MGSPGKAVLVFTDLEGSLCGEGGVWAQDGNALGDPG